MTDRLQRSRADSAQLLHAANELAQREARLCARRDVIIELESALAVPLTQRNILCSSVVSDEFFDALDVAHAVCRWAVVVAAIHAEQIITLSTCRRCDAFLSTAHRTAVSEALQESRNLVQRSLSTVYSWLEQQSSR
jgi:hypothetical protein